MTVVPYYSANEILKCFIKHVRYAYKSLQTDFSISLNTIDIQFSRNEYFPKVHSTHKEDIKVVNSKINCDRKWNEYNSKF